MAYLARKIHHDEQERLQESLLILQNPNERQPFHEKFDGDHSP